MKLKSFTLFVSLWITTHAYAWGELGHRVIAEYGSGLVDSKTLANCHVTAAQLVAHTNDPDKIWRQQRLKHRNEPLMHFFHIDRQPADWRTRSRPYDPSQGWLVYRISDWIADARKLRAAQDWGELAEHLYGISHYLGDLTQPLHVHHDYDGKESGLPGLHAQFETKMLKRFEAEVRAGIRNKLTAEKVPALWIGKEPRLLVMDIAQQSNAKAARLFKGSAAAMIFQKKSRQNHSHQPAMPRFEKKTLWKNTGDLATEQLALGARLLAFTLSSVCR